MLYGPRGFTMSYTAPFCKEGGHWRPRSLQRFLEYMISASGQPPSTSSTPLHALHTYTWEQHRQSPKRFPNTRPANQVSLLLNFNSIRPHEGAWLSGLHQFHPATVRLARSKILRTTGHDMFALFAGLLSTIRSPPPPLLTHTHSLPWDSGGS